MGYRKRGKREQEKMAHKKTKTGSGKATQDHMKIELTK